MQIIVFVYIVLAQNDVWDMLERGKIIGKFFTVHDADHHLHRNVALRSAVLESGGGQSPLAHRVHSVFTAVNTDDRNVLHPVLLQHQRGAQTHFIVVRQDCVKLNATLNPVLDDLHRLVAFKLGILGSDKLDAGVLIENIVITLRSFQCADRGRPSHQDCDLTGVAHHPEQFFCTQLAAVNVRGVDKAKKFVRVLHRTGKAYAGDISGFLANLKDALAIRGVNRKNDHALASVLDHRLKLGKQRIRIIARVIEDKLVFSNKVPDWKTQVKSVLDSPTDTTACSFIKQMYSSRGKSLVFEWGMPDEINLFQKGIHTFSAFMIGLLFKSVIENFLKPHVNRGPWYDLGFNYIWFLACLYHDTTTEFERKFQKSANSFELQNLTSLREMVELLSDEYGNISYDIYNESHNEWTHDIELPPNHHTYPEEIVRRYFAMRLENGKLDHGITAGVILYDSLMRNYERVWSDESRAKLPERIDKSRFYTSVNGRTLVWRKEQLWVFGYVADAIIAHNIWHIDERQNPDDAQKYNAYGLGLLVHKKGKQDGKLTISKDPLAFYMGLIDSIEPVKFFYNVDPRYIWEHISIELNKNAITLSQSGTALDFNKWYETKIKDLPIWLSGIEVIPPVDNVIKIRVN